MPDDAQTGLERDTAEIVSAYVRHHQLSADQVAALIRSVHTALSNLGKPTEEEVERSPAVPIRRSVHRDYVVCLECGWRGKMLRRHIGTLHDLGPGEYRHRWGLSADHLLTAPGYSETRSGLAKQLGLGRRGRDADTAASPEPEPPPEPRNVRAGVVAARPQNRNRAECGAGAAPALTLSLGCDCLCASR